MRNAGGYAIMTGPDGVVDECDTYTCAHCNKVVHVPVKANPDDLGGFCRMCMKMICPHCVQTGLCDPFEKKLKRMEEAGEWRRRFGCDAV